MMITKAKLSKRDPCMYLGSTLVLELLQKIFSLDTPLDRIDSYVFCFIENVFKPS